MLQKFFSSDFNYTILMFSLLIILLFYPMLLINYHVIVWNNNSTSPTICLYLHGKYRVTLPILIFVCISWVPIQPIQESDMSLDFKRHVWQTCRLLTAYAKPKITIFRPYAHSQFDSTMIHFCPPTIRRRGL